MCRFPSDQRDFFLPVTIPGVPVASAAMEKEEEAVDKDVGDGVGDAGVDEFVVIVIHEVQ